MNIQHGLKRIGSPAFQQKIREAEIASETRYVTAEDVRWIVNDVTEGNWKRLEEQDAITGEWIMFAKHDGKNYYLTMATHDPSTHQGVRHSIDAFCCVEFPFLRELLGDGGK